MSIARGIRWALLVTCLTAAGMARAQEAAPAPVPDRTVEEFRDPPMSARPRVWWHWMNGNVTEEGITKDLEWMKRVGIGGLQNFDANLMTPQVVDQRLVYMTPGWKKAFRHAASLADRLGLELAIAASPGWSETGGPWVKPQDGLKKLVWSETAIRGGKRFRGVLAAPPSITGPYQAMPKAAGLAGLSGGKSKAGPVHYRDIAVLAYRAAPRQVVLPKSASMGGAPVDPAALFDDSLESALAVPAGTSDQPGAVQLDYGTPQTIRSATLLAPGAKPPFGSSAFEPELQASDDGTNWRTIATFRIDPVPTTVAFAPVTARYFRLLLSRNQGGGGLNFESAPGSAMSMDGILGAAPKSVKVAQLSLSPEARIDQFQTKAGFALSQDYYALASSADAGEAGVAPAEVIDLTTRMQPDGSIDWTPPKGEWRVLRLGYSLIGTENHPAPPEATGLEVDKFDGPAVRNYLETYIGMYRDAAGADLIGKRGVRALLTDSIEVGAANWTPQMVAQFKRLRGYDPTPWLPALSGVVVDTRAKSDAFLYDYRRTLADLMSSEHYGTVAKVAHEHGLTVYGEALEDHRPSLGDDMAMRSHTDVPMAAMWTWREAGPKLTYIADIKGAASVAHIYGQNLVAAESLTSGMSPWAHAPSDLRKMIDLEFATGVNRPVIHTSVHQPVDDKFPGVTLFIFGQYFNRHESWAEMARPWVDYIARNSYLLQQGRNFADVGYFYGEEAPITGLYGDKQVADAPAHNAWDFVNAAALTEALSVENGELVAKGGARYRLLYLGGASSRMTLPVLRRLAELVEAGAVVAGNAPTASPSAADDPAEWRAQVARLWGGTPVTTLGKGKVIAGNNVDAALAAIGVAPDFRFTGAAADAQILFVHRKLDDGHAYFLNNRRDRAEKVEARFRVTGMTPEIWRADTGTSTPVSYRTEGGETVVPLDIAPEDSFFVLFRKPAQTPSLTLAAPVSTQVATLDGPWEVAFQPGRSAPASVTLPALASLSEQSDPGVKYFSGVATYRRSFALPKGAKPGAPLWLDLGKVGDLAEVWVNGQQLGTVWHAPYRIDIGRAVKRGANKIEIRVANLWVNRLIGDAQPGAKKITYTSMPTYRADAPLRPSGLIGPVTLSTVR